jgi:hypothetical protein
MSLSIAIHGADHSDFKERRVCPRQTRKEIGLRVQRLKKYLKKLRVAIDPSTYGAEISPRTRAGFVRLEASTGCASHARRLNNYHSHVSDDAQ